MVSNLLAVAVGLIAWPLISYTYPNLISQHPFRGRSFDWTWQHAPSNSSGITPQLATFIEDTLVLENITGLSVAVVPKQGEPELHAWGYRTEDGDRMTPDTLFPMASVSKAFCATAMGLLIDDFAEGRNVTALPAGMKELTWHSRLKDVLPDDWALMDAWASERANLKDILSHLSGLPRTLTFCFARVFNHEASYGPSDTRLDMIRRLKHLRPAFELREQWSYNNIMYVVAAHVIETYAGQSYASFVQERIFVPLGMTSSTFSPTAAKATGKFTQGWTKNGRRIPERFSEETTTTLAGAGGVISNAIDMAKWISTWINEGVYDGRAVIPAHVYRNVSSAHSVVAGHPPDSEHSISGYGMGWARYSYRGHDVVWHNGGLPGVNALVSFFPADEIGITLFANGDQQIEPLTLISNRILDSALGLKRSLTPTSSPSRNVTKLDVQHRTFSLSLDIFSGTYSNPGYGSFTLCSPSSTLLYCTQVQSDFAIVDNTQRGGSPTVAQMGEDLLAAWPRVVASHVRMRRRQELVFDVFFTSLFPKGYGRDTTPFETREVGAGEFADGLVEFVIEEGRVVGFGVSGMVGVMTERERTYESVRDRAEVWFDRV